MSGCASESKEVLKNLVAHGIGAQLQANIWSLGDYDPSLYIRFIAEYDAKSS